MARKMAWHQWHGGEMKKKSVAAKVCQYQRNEAASKSAAAAAKNENQ